ncbi:hypothetical protein CQW23_22309 [Capsicum baccatum]|uniref:Uncharacterized protein n=1 Tax=Capsicum baccatum TaxID=33114 RepID=A0A2G2W0H9_CAPBA|nr:hypothetical protein CQW23_22309 [Capsicum baccatum]
MGKAIEIESSTASSSRLYIEYGRNSIRKANSIRFNNESSNSVTEVSGRFFNGSDWNKQTILIQSGSSANHVKESILDGLVRFKENSASDQDYESENSVLNSLLGLLNEDDKLVLIVVTQGIVPILVRLLDSSSSPKIFSRLSQCSFDKEIESFGFE